MEIGQGGQPERKWETQTIALEGERQVTKNASHLHALPSSQTSQFSTKFYIRGKLYETQNYNLYIEFFSGNHSLLKIVHFSLAMSLLIEKYFHFYSIIMIQWNFVSVGGESSFEGQRVEKTGAPLEFHRRPDLSDRAPSFGAVQQQGARVPHDADLGARPGARGQPNQGTLRGARRHRQAKRGWYKNDLIWKCLHSTGKLFEMERPELLNNFWIKRRAITKRNS